MTTIARPSTSAENSTEVQLAVRDDATAAQRDNAQQSIAALIARSSAAFERRRAAEADATEVTSALNRPFLKLLEADPSAATALKKLHNDRLVEREDADELSRSGLGHQAREVESPGPVLFSSAGFVPPYDFSWAWHDTNGHAPHNLIVNRSTGGVGVDARSGQIAGGASGFVNAHCGFGVFLRSSTTKTVFPHAVLNPGRFSFATRAVGIGSNATSEGGFELTVFEDGRFLAAASRKLWRSRVSGSFGDPDESASGGQGPQLIAGPEFQFTIRAGHEYTFNAGIWAFSDRSTGVGAGAVQSLMEGIITRMWVFGLPA